MDVVIPNYNGYCLLVDNIPRLKAAINLMDVSIKIWVCDDASDDLSVKFLKENHPDINMGYVCF